MTVENSGKSRGKRRNWCVTKIYGLNTVLLYGILGQRNYTTRKRGIDELCVSVIVLTRRFVEQRNLK
ncbi:hypothetical protein TcasGA2_TC014411 [Tribolium castaneum]|uniref:Uncharacterized protein n=1 Tax=Tribolium castaneum TaxID=7070 RepID=D6WLU3_TRICA|nr:hypothetical protein TcasGA2_TC014411 [Tribolium castaneum]